MQLSNLIIIPMIVAFLAYLFNRKIKYTGGVINTLLFGYLLMSITDLYGKWEISQTFNYHLFGYDLNLVLNITSLSWLFALMTAAAGLLIAIFTIKSQENFTKVAAFNFNFPLLVASILGVVLAGDFITLFISWELMTWTSFYLISAGKKKKAKKAAYRYFILSAVGAYLMLIAILIIFNSTGSLTYPVVMQFLAGQPVGKSLLLITMMTLTFLIKAGVFPVHVWVNDAHGTAPNEFSPFLSGLMLKVGAYGLLLMFYLMPLSKILSNSISYRGLPIFNYIFALFGAITTVSGTILAIRQEDVKRLVAFSSISQMGYIIMALSIFTPLGFAGGMLHIINHLIFKTTIFLTIAAVVYRTGTTKMAEMGGLIFRMPVTFAAYLTAIIALAGIPPTNGFISKWVIYQALIQKGYLFLAIAAFFGSIASFMYVFKPLSTIFLGQLKPKHENIKEIPFLMQIPMYILMGLMLLFGVLPGIQMKIINKIAEQLGINTVPATLYTIQGAFGSWNTLIIFNVFTGGFIIALIVFLLARKSKRVGLLDTFTAGEYMNDAEAYHFAYQYFRPFDRIFDGFANLSLTRAYDVLANNVVKLGNSLRQGLVNGNGQTYAMYTVLLFVIMVIVGWII